MKKLSVISTQFPMDAWMSAKTVYCVLAKTHPVITKDDDIVERKKKGKTMILDYPFQYIQFAFLLSYLRLPQND